MVRVRTSKTRKTQAGIPPINADGTACFMVTMSALDLEALEYIRASRYYTKGVQALRFALATQAAPESSACKNGKAVSAQVEAELRGLAIRLRKPAAEMSPADTGRKCVYRMSEQDRTNIVLIKMASGLDHWSQAIRYAILRQAYQDGWSILA